VLCDDDMCVGGIRRADVHTDWLQGFKQALEFDRDQLLVETGDGFWWHGPPSGLYSLK
jgi:hypothetical protein